MILDLNLSTFIFLSKIKIHFLIEQTQPLYKFWVFIDWSQGIGGFGIQSNQLQTIQNQTRRSRPVNSISDEAGDFNEIWWPKLRLSITVTTAATNQNGEQRTFTRKYWTWCQWSVKFSFKMQCVRSLGGTILG